MKSKHAAFSRTWALWAILLVIVVVGVVALANSEDLQGRFGGMKGKGSIKSPTPVSSSSSSQVYATIAPKGGSVTTQTVDLSEIDPTAVDDEENIMDAYDLAWYTVGYWEVTLDEGYSLCSGAGKNNMYVGLDTGSGSTGGFASLSDDGRLVLRNSAGATQQVLESAGGGHTVFNPTVALTGTFRIQYDAHVKNKDLDQVGEEYNVYLTRLCVTDGSTEYEYEAPDTGENKYFSVSSGSSTLGAKGGIIKFQE